KLEKVLFGLRTFKRSRFVPRYSLESIWREGIMCKAHEDASETAHATTNRQRQTNLEGNAKEEQRANEKERMRQDPIKRAPDNIKANEVVLNYFNLRGITGGRLLDIFGTKKDSVIDFNSFIIGLARVIKKIFIFSFSQCHLFFHFITTINLLVEKRTSTKAFILNKQNSRYVDKNAWTWYAKTDTKEKFVGCWSTSKNDIIFRDVIMASAKQINLLFFLLKKMLIWYLKHNIDYDLFEQMEYAPLVEMICKALSNWWK
ncbi:hypothetical protein RFI_31244, partial [Reticulomyxa filosa]